MQDLADLLRWAIDQGLDGFCEDGAIIGVATAAKALGVSRTTMTQALSLLVAAGKLIARPSAPYLVVNQGRQLPDPQDLASAPISLTEKLADESILGPPLQVAWTDAQSPHLRFFQEALAQSADRAVRDQFGQHDAFTHVYFFRRLRHIAGEDGKRRVACLIELSGLLLPEAERGKLRSALAFFEPGRSARLSLSQLLGLAGVQGLRDGRTRVEIGPVPALLQDDVQDILRHQDPQERLTQPIDASNLLATGVPLLRWEYGLFATRPAGLISFSVCSVDPKVVKIFAKDLDLTPKSPGER